MNVFYIKRLIEHVLGQNLIAIAQYWRSSSQDEIVLFVAISEGYGTKQRVPFALRELQRPGVLTFSYTGKR